MAVQIRKASRQKVKIKLGLNGPSGSGKTMGALKLAKGLVGSWEKVVLLDTENGSGELYSHLGDYSVISLAPPFTPERYIECIKAAEQAGFEAMVLDSVSHEWEGKGGILEISNGMTGNSFTNWAKLTPRHNNFIDTLLHSPLHVICTLRSKTDYVMVEKNGKQVPEKVGLKAVTREGWEFDLTVVFDLDMKNSARVSKDRTNLFMNQPEFVITEGTGEMIKQWCESGVEAIKEEDPFPAPVKKGLGAKAFEQAIGRLKEGEIAVFERVQADYNLTEEQHTTLVTTYESVKKD